jgi:capsule polysaccharide modification protein KpsS
LLKLYDSGLFTRYKQIDQVVPERLPENYILVVMQNTGSTVWYKKNFTDLAKDIVLWSRENKRNVIFKWHNGCIDHDNPTKWFNDLPEKSKYCSIDFTSPLSVLIKNCSIVWTASSMSGIESLICNKPVAVFGETEYMEMTQISNSPDDAIKTKIPNDLDQWLTYYVRKYCINIYAKDSIQRVRNRVINHFEKRLPLNELILSE